MIIINLITSENRSYHQRKKGPWEKRGGGEKYYTRRQCVYAAQNEKTVIIGISIFIYISVCVMSVCIRVTICMYVCMYVMYVYTERCIYTHACMCTFFFLVSVYVFLCMYVFIS